jgi:hypothetical protein
MGGGSRPQCFHDPRLLRRHWNRDLCYHIAVANQSTYSQGLVAPENGCFQITMLPCLLLQIKIDRPATGDGPSRGKAAHHAPKQVNRFVHLHR